MPSVTENLLIYKIRDANGGMSVGRIQDLRELSGPRRIKDPEVVQCLETFHALNATLPPLPIPDDNQITTSDVFWEKSPRHFRTFGVVDGKLKVIDCKASDSENGIQFHYSEPRLRGLDILHLRKFVENGGCSEDLKVLAYGAIRNNAIEGRVRISNITHSGADTGDETISYLLGLQFDETTETFYSFGPNMVQEIFQPEELKVNGLAPAWIWQPEGFPPQIAFGSQMTMILSFE